MRNWFELSDEDDQALAAFMARVAALPTAPAAHDPMTLWWKAQLVKRWDAERRAQAPLDVIERVEIVAGLTAAGVLLFWAVPTVSRMIAAPLLALLG